MLLFILLYQYSYLGIHISIHIHIHYSYSLYECVEEIPSVSPPTCPAPVEVHVTPNICQTLGQRIRPCSYLDPGTGNTINARYMCAITGGPSTPTEDAYIEWHWYTTTTSGSIDYIFNGKFIFVASAAYIASQHTLYGYSGITLGSGIGMFNPSNHNP